MVPGVGLALTTSRGRRDFGSSGRRSGLIALDGCCGRVLGPSGFPVRRSGRCRVHHPQVVLATLLRRLGANYMRFGLRPSSIDRFRAARKAFAVLALCATVLVPMELLGTATAGATGPSTAVALPSNGAMVSGSIWVVASAQSAAGVVSVHFEVSGGLISDMTVATTGPTACCGWLGAWDTTDVPNGNYMLQSVVTDKAGNSATSPAVSVTVDNLPLHTQVLIPSAGATVGGNVFLDASAQGTAPVTGVTFTATQGSTVETVATATPTIYGWIAEWPSGVGPNNGSLAYDSGTWSIQSVATEVGGTTATSSPVQITLVTIEDLVSSSNFTLTSGGICGLYPLLSTYSGVYPGSTSVGTVSLAADPCSGFTLSTDVGSVSGPIAIAGMGDLYILQVTNGTGLFTGTTGEGLFLGIFPGPPATGDVSVA